MDKRVRKRERTISFGNIREKGFLTVPDVIVTTVVIVVVALVCALGVLKFVNKPNESRVHIDSETVYRAAQSIATEYYALKKDMGREFADEVIGLSGFEDEDTRFIMHLIVKDGTILAYSFEENEMIIYWDCDKGFSKVMEKDGSEMPEWFVPYTEYNKKGEKWHFVVIRKK